MLRTVKLEVSREEIVAAVKRMKRKKREAFLKDVLASISPEYLASIREAREQYNAGKVRTHAQVFGRVGTQGRVNTGDCW